MEEGLSLGGGVTGGAGLDGAVDGAGDELRLRYVSGMGSRQGRKLA